MTNWPEFERFGALMLAHDWIYAKTMPANPHHYTLRKRWERDADFVWAVEYLRAHGYHAKFGGRAYIQHDLNEHFYWTMGAPINTASGDPCTILINRKVRGGLAPYDKLAPGYDDLFATPESEAEDLRVREIIGPVNLRDTVLDVGCGTGLALRLGISTLGYTGIDPSGAMLERLRGHFPGANVVRTPLQTFMPRGVMNEPLRFDHVLALYGVGSYLTDDELSRIPLLLCPGGQATVMFYAPGYVPVTHTAGDVRAVYTPWGIPRTRAFFKHIGERGGLATVHMIGHHVLLAYRKNRP